MGSRGMGGARSGTSVLALALILLAVGAACGTRVEQPGSTAATIGRAAASASSTPLPSAQPTDGGQVSPRPDVAAAPATPAATGHPSSPSVSAPGVSAAPGASRAAGPAPRPSSAGTASSPVSPTAAPQPGSRPSPPGQPAPTAPTGHTPLVVASVGTHSGVVGSVVKPILDAAMVWVKEVNAHGGLGGHPVKVITYDDGGDPARHRAQMQDAVERQKVQAFFTNLEVVTGRASVDYVNQVGIPVIGTDMSGDWGYASPMYFQQGIAGHRVVFTGVAAAAEYLLPQGKKKLGSLMCVEVEACDANTTAASAKAVGFDHVYQAKASIAQPDFTAECLEARNASADVFFLVMDTNSMTRVGTACGRQGYKPVYASVTSVVSDRFAQDPNLTGMIAAIGTFPWFQTGTPATDAFQTAMKAYGANLAKGVAQATGWAAGKLLERAAASLSEPPSTADLLRGLWSMKDETLGGLTAPLTFVKGTPQQPRSCWFTILVSGGRWTSPDNYRTRCATAPSD